MSFISLRSSSDNSPFFTLASPDFFTPEFTRRRWVEPAWFIIMLLVYTVALAVGTHGVRPGVDADVLSSCAGGTPSQ